MAAVVEAAAPAVVVAGTHQEVAEVHTPDFHMIQGTVACWHHEVVLPDFQVASGIFRRRLAAGPLDPIIDVFTSGFASFSTARSSQSVTMLLKQFLFLGFSAIILHNASHPARSKVGSPSALHCAKLNRLIPVIADVLHKLALGTQCGMQARISAGVSLMHASCHSSCCNLIWLSSDSGSLSQRMQ